MMACKQGAVMNDDTYEKGLAIRKEVLGEGYVNASLSKADDFNADFQRLVTEYCWGAGWGREGVLSRRDRSLMNIVLLGALNRGEEFKLHVRGALRNGVTREEIRETLIHLSIYAGIPAGVEGFRLARQVLAEVDAEGAA